MRAVHEREREVEPPAHAARVAADAAVGGLGEADALEQLRGARRARRAAAQAVQRALHAQQLAAGHQRVDRRLLQRDADRAPDRVGRRATTSWPATSARAGGRPQQRGEDAHRRSSCPRRSGPRKP